MLWMIVLIILTFAVLFFTLGINYYALLSFSFLSADKHAFLRYGLTFLLSLVTTILLFMGRFDDVLMPWLLYGGITGISMGAILLRKTYQNDTPFQPGAIIIQLVLYSLIGIVMAYFFHLLIAYIFSQMVGLF
jgi:hypothetical protein